MQQVEGKKKNKFLSSHNQSKNTQSKKIEYLCFRPELCHTRGGGEYTCFWLHTLSDVPPNTKPHYEFTKLLSNSSFIRGIQIHYDLHPLDLLTFPQRPKIQKVWGKQKSMDNLQSTVGSKNVGKFLHIFGKEELTNQLSSVFFTLRVLLSQWNKCDLSTTSHNSYRTLATWQQISACL